MEWFDVKDRLPAPKRGYYLVSCIYEDDRTPAHIGVCYYDQHMGWVFENATNYSMYKDLEEFLVPSNITHWMPFPRDPRGISIYNFDDDKISEKII